MPKANNPKDGLANTWGRANRRIADKKCANCGSTFRPKASKHTTCSRACGYAVRVIVQPRKNKGDGWINSKGYREIKVDGKNVKEHRHLVEQSLGRRLETWEDVHHKDGNKLNNCLSNLEVISHSAHTKISNNRPYKKGYKLTLTEDQRKARSERMSKMVKQRHAISKALQP